MSDDMEPADTPWWHTDELLRPGPCAVTAVALSFLVLSGGSLMIQATQALFGAWFAPDGDFITYAAVYVTGALVPVLVAVYLSYRAITDARAAAWELVVARSSVVLSLVAVVYVGVTLLGVAIHHY